MIERQLVMRMKLDGKRDGFISVQTNISSWAISYNESLHNIISWSLSILKEDGELMKLFWAKSDFSNLNELIKLGYVVRIDKAEEGYGIIVSKDTCSVEFNGIKEKGIAEILLQADEWAKTMLEELDSTTVNKL